MTWIRTIPPTEADDKLRAIYAELRAACPPEYHEVVPALARKDGTADSIVAAHSLLPEAMYHIFSAFNVLMSPGLALERRQQEMIATLVSSLNHCHY